MKRRTSVNGHRNGHAKVSTILDNMLLNEAVGRQLTTNLNFNRADFLKGLLDPRRDIDDECGFPKDPVRLEVYQRLFDRHPIANRYVSIMDDECWQETPEVYETEDPDKVTEFEDRFDHLGDNLLNELHATGAEENFYEDQESCSNPVYSFLKRWGVEAGIGEYGVMFLGFNDKKSSLQQPLKRGSADKLLFIRVFSQSEAQVQTWDQDPESPRYGRPLTYSLDLIAHQTVTSITGSRSYGSLDGVHYSRVLHLTKDPGSDNYLSRPLLRPVLNDILSLSKPLYGSGEGYWRSGLPTFLAKTDPKLGGSVRINRARIRDQIEQWTNTLQKSLIANGWSLEAISGQVQDPSAFIDKHIESICIKGAYPKRVFLGSERGELASSDDAKKWEARKREYRKNLITPKQIVPFTNRCIYAGVLPAPKSYYASWTTDEHLTDAEKADIFVKKMQGLSAAVSGGVTTFIGEMGVMKAAGYTDDEAQQMLDDAALEQEKEQQVQEQQQAQLPQPPNGQPPNSPPNGQPPQLARQPIPPNRQLPAPKPMAPKPATNKFCPTGAGGGIDPSCGGEGGSIGTPIPPGVKGSGTKEDPYAVGKDIKLAAKLLAEGKHVRLKQPDQVSTLLVKMNKMVGEAVDKGEKAPNFDLCKVSVKDTNLFCQDNIGIPRINMPQMKGVALPGSKAAAKGVDKKGEVDLSRDFVEHMRSKGIKTEETTVRASHLRASQNEIVGTKIARMVTEAKAGERDLREKPIFVTRDNYVVDGHHHWAALVGLGAAKGKDFKVPVFKLDTDIGTALSMANEYTKSMGIKPKAAVANKRKPTKNRFCPTGVGGGIDPSCGSEGGGTHAHPPSEGLAHGGEAVEHLAHAFHAHEGALGLLGHAGGTASAIGAAVTALKLAGVKIGHAEHVVKAYIADKVGRAVAKLPEHLQKIVRGAWAGVRIATAAAFISYTAGQAFAERVSAERGHTPEQARRLRGVLSSLDVTAAKPVALTLGPAASFVPVASLSYLAYSTARDPVATLRAARGALGSLGKKVKGIVGNEDPKDLLVKALEAHEFDDYYIALLSVALDATQDIPQAIAAANEAYDADNS
jgi:hypothetical protein